MFGQVLSNLGTVLYTGFMAAANGASDSSVIELQTVRQDFVELLSDLDRVLRASPELSFETWIDAALVLASNEAEKELYNFNARNLVTRWGLIESTSPINDYASRQWSGLVSGYYKQRWMIALDAVVEHKRRSPSVPLFARTNFNCSAETVPDRWCGQVVGLRRMTDDSLFLPQARIIIIQLKRASPLRRFSKRSLKLAPSPIAAITIVLPRIGPSLNSLMWSIAKHACKCLPHGCVCIYKPTEIR